MSMTLILWKAPVVDDPDAAEALLTPYYDREDDSGFEASGDLAAVADELLRRFPNSEDGPWADFPPDQTERILLLSIRWSAGNAVIDAITALARKHALVLYDPQGPDVHLPDEPVDTEPAPKPGIADYLTFVLIGLVALGVFLLGWWIDVPVIKWILRIVGGFFVAVVLFLLGILLFGPKEDKASSPR